jgi:Tol biopolymer transport system component
MQIRVINSDGSNDRPLTDVFPGSINVTPRWSPDGSMIAYASGRRTDPNPLVWPTTHIWTTRADGLEKKQLISGSSADFAPTWSSDGKSIAFTSSRNGGRYQIWRMNADGTNPVQLTHALYDSTVGAPIEQKVPIYSPNGKYIAYWSGVEQSQLSLTLLQGKTPPNDRDLKVVHTWHIWLMNADGSHQHELTQGDDPAWSPDSTMVMHPTLPIYGSNPQPTGPGEPTGVGVTNIDGANRRTLFTTPSGPSGFSWRPI